MIVPGYFLQQQPLKPESSHNGGAKVFPAAGNPKTEV